MVYDFDMKHNEFYVFQDMKWEHVYIFNVFFSKSVIKILGSAVEFRYLFSFTSNFQYAGFVK